MTPLRAILLTSSQLTPQHLHVHPLNPAFLPSWPGDVPEPQRLRSSRYILVESWKLVRRHLAFVQVDIGRAPAPDHAGTPAAQRAKSQVSSPPFEPNAPEESREVHHNTGGIGDTSNKLKRSYQGRDSNSSHEGHRKQEQEVGKRHWKTKVVA